MTRGLRLFIATRSACVAAVIGAGLAAAPAAAPAGEFAALLTPELLADYATGYTPTFVRLERAPTPPPRPAITAAELQRYVANGYQPTQARRELTARERLCLAQAVYFEARGEPEAGQWAIARVVLNRVANGNYPGHVCDVVFQGASRRGHCQFSFACDGRSDVGGNGNRIVRESWVKANLIADEAYRRYLQDRPAVGELPASTLFFHARRVSPSWASAYQPVASIGAHVFYAGL